MPDSGCLFLSIASLLVGVLLFLNPRALAGLSAWLNRTMTILDKSIIRHRYVVGLLAFGASYAFFKLALLLPSLRS